MPATAQYSKRVSRVISSYSESVSVSSSSIPPLGRLTQFPPLSSTPLGLSFSSTPISFKPDDDLDSPHWIPGSQAVFTTPKFSPAKTRRRTTMISLNQETGSRIRKGGFKIPSPVIKSPPGVKTRRGRSSVYVSVPDREEVVELRKKKNATVKRAGKTALPKGGTKKVIVEKALLSELNPSLGNRGTLNSKKYIDSLVKNAPSPKKKGIHKVANQESLSDFTKENGRRNGRKRSNPVSPAVKRKAKLNTSVTKGTKMSMQGKELDSSDNNTPVKQARMSVVKKTEKSNAKKAGKSTVKKTRKATVKKAGKSTKNARRPTSFRLSTKKSEKNPEAVDVSQVADIAASASPALQTPSKTKQKSKMPNRKKLVLDKKESRKSKGSENVNNTSVNSEIKKSPSPRRSPVKSAAKKRQVRQRFSDYSVDLVGNEEDIVDEPVAVSKSDTKNKSLVTSPPKKSRKRKSLSPGQENVSQPSPKKRQRNSATDIKTRNLKKSPVKEVQEGRSSKTPLRTKTSPVKKVQEGRSPKTPLRTKTSPVKEVQEGRSPKTPLRTNQRKSTLPRSKAMETKTNKSVTPVQKNASEITSKKSKRKSEAVSEKKAGKKTFNKRQTRSFGPSLDTDSSPGKKRRSPTPRKGSVKTPEKNISPRHSKIISPSNNENQKKSVHKLTSKSASKSATPIKKSAKIQHGKKQSADKVKAVSLDANASTDENLEIEKVIGIMFQKSDKGSPKKQTPRKNFSPAKNARKSTPARVVRKREQKKGELEVPLSGMSSLTPVVAKLPSPPKKRGAVSPSLARKDRVFRLTLTEKDALASPSLARPNVGSSPSFARKSAVKIKTITKKDITASPFLSRRESRTSPAFAREPVVTSPSLSRREIVKTSEGRKGVIKTPSVRVTTKEVTITPFLGGEEVITSLSRKTVEEALPGGLSRKEISTTPSRAREIVTSPSIAKVQVVTTLSRDASRKTPSLSVTEDLNPSLARRREIITASSLSRQEIVATPFRKKEILSSAPQEERSSLNVSDASYGQDVVTRAYREQSLLSPVSSRLGRVTHSESTARQVVTEAYIESDNYSSSVRESQSLLDVMESSCDDVDVDTTLSHTSHSQRCTIF